MMILCLYQVFYMNSNEGAVNEDWSNYIKSLYIVGIFGPIMNYLFIYFLITRLNEKVRTESNPAFLDTDANEIEDYDDKALINDSHQD